MISSTVLCIWRWIDPQWVNSMFNNIPWTSYTISRERWQVFFTLIWPYPLHLIADNAACYLGARYFWLHSLRPRSHLLHVQHNGHHSCDVYLRVQCCSHHRISDLRVQRNQRGKLRLFSSRLFYPLLFFSFVFSDHTYQQLPTISLPQTPLFLTPCSAIGGEELRYRIRFTSLRRIKCHLLDDMIATSFIQMGEMLVLLGIRLWHLLQL